MNTLDGLKINISVSEIRRLNPLCLAYIGDAVFELMVRSKILDDLTVNTLTKLARSYVSAKAQNEMYHKLDGRLSDEEQAVMKRGRNSKPASAAKNASLSEYRHATGVEALFGYLYLHGRMDRLGEIFEMCVARDS